MIRVWRGNAVIVALSLAVSGCSVPPERVIIADFFAASRLRDLTALAAFATTVFEPRDQGTVSDFRILSIREPRASGQGATKDVVILAPVRKPDGSTVDERMTIVLRVDAQGNDGRLLYGGWRVVEVRR